ncbi:GNAT family N-acetyltransferase [Streptomyces alfalfae]|uniref:GCN5 family acetyltransferase n=1 Tax=Streptomyces alfalfae TaxID=1642299 RepID=A0ABM6H191_9ACTN|nr:GNAT family N-acetyltransferase [Streptomyces alfalfae]AYA21565.1 GNAT family N-acetyltransferase [Streptomyces fradiae]APY90069.1 GCN5 family acetyltransferase [Streptomyces alfalfae]QUI29854.1 GNAT family N-acetyltransferase [Streptomyces alfalfae]RXX35032.1 GNAT family N-acetyltransferase [Streptomyces alfalfae]RZM91596.1 GNAT family N-acetyltransferase [Streptomyces alfalfae]
MTTTERPHASPRSPRPRHPLRTIEAHEFDAWATMVTTTYGQDWRDGALRNAAHTFEPERTLAAYDGPDIVGGVSVYGRTLTVPGALVPVAGITLVAVLPTHRRRGILTSMMRRQLTDLHASQGEPIAALNAAEATIYGRYGYGVASHLAAVDADKRAMRLRPDTDLGSGSIRLLAPAAARPLFEKVYDQARRQTVGWVDRTEKYWNARLRDDVELFRDGATALRFAVHTEPDGAATGYALYRSRGDTVRLTELAALTTTSYAALWNFVINLDAHSRLTYDAAVDEPLGHLLVDPRPTQATVVDNLWVRLVDVDRALTARRYATALDVVLDVEDDVCPWNAGRYRLSTDGVESVTCERVRGVRPDLRLSVAELGSVYLGGPTLASLAAAGRVEELRPGAVAAASVAFRGRREPFHVSGAAFPAF